MITEAIVLAGGFGTRLSHLLGNVPKPMAPVAGKPFLTYLLDSLDRAGIKRVVLATGYRHEVIHSYFGNRYKQLSLVYSHETEPLLTGGAILQATQQIQGEHFLVFNGDTLFSVDLNRLSNHHLASNAPLTMALRKVDDTARYGAVRTKGTRILSFTEKSASQGAGLINGGIYAIQKTWLSAIRNGKPAAFSFEKEVLPCFQDLEGLSFDSYFIDIGIPDDYHRAQRDFVALSQPDRYLFLDRDGVINRKIDGGYVCRWEDFVWLPGVLPTLRKLSQRFRRIFVVTNQQGIAKGCFTEQTLHDIHRRMLTAIDATGGHIDRVYVAPDLANSGSTLRKPETGMAQQAIADYPEVELSRSVMAGDSVSDIEFGYRAGMRCVFLTNGLPVPDSVKDMTDLVYKDLTEMEATLTKE